MDDIKQGNEGARVLGPILGFALGALVGGGLALLLAPASGETTRRRLGSAARRMSRDARQALDGARETVGAAANDLGGDVKAAIDAGREAFRHESETNETRPVSRIGQIVNPTARPSL